MNFSDATDIRLGSSTITALYYGSTLIWPTTPPTPVDWEREYLQVEAIYPVVVTTSIPSTTQTGVIEYSLDKTTWSDWNENVSVSLAAGDKLYFKGSNYSEGSLLRNQNTSSSPGTLNVMGNIMSLIYGDNFYANRSSLYGYTYCFDHLFAYAPIVDASNLKLTATTLDEGCYRYMFGWCMSLITPPQLPATSLAPACYISMFYACSSLTTAPALNATTLVEQCYMGMFENCTSLTTAPDLPAATLADLCYRSMFTGCSSLNYIKCLATDKSAISCTSEWVMGVAATGTFVKDIYTTWPTGDSGIPTGWTIENQGRDDPGPEPINWAEEYMQVIAADPLTITTDIGTTYTYQFIIPQYSLDGVTWNSWNNSVSLNLNADDIVYFKGTYNAGSYRQYNSKPLFKTTTANAHYDIAGNAMSLLYGDNFIGQTSIASYSSCFRRLFYNCSNMIDASRLILPATTLSNLCYHSMFEACSSLEVAPELPALTCANECYHDMFHGCALVEPPELPATTLAQYCYAGMFNGNPFTSITLPATTLTTRCYEWMFYNCSHLNEITCLATTNINTTNLYNWTGGVPANGTFIKDVNASYSTGNNGIPSGWTVQDYSQQ